MSGQFVLQPTVFLLILNALVVLVEVGEGEGGAGPGEEGVDQREADNDGEDGVDIGTFERHRFAMPPHAQFTLACLFHNLLSW